MTKSSVISGFYKLPPKERLAIIKDFAGLTDEEIRLLENTGSLPMDVADHMVENVIGVFPEPLGIGVNFQINGKDYLIPMATEEPSVIAAASYAAKMVRDGGGFHTSSTAPVMIGQIQVVKIKDAKIAKKQVLDAKAEILKKANDQDPVLNSFGGGAKDLDAKVIDTTMGQMLIVELYVDCRDAMGANAVNTMAEAVAPMIEQLTGGHVYLRIISNLATKRLAKAWCTVPKEALGGEAVVEGIAYASAFAAADPYRAATHNKGAMNGIIAVVLATGNDHRAIEAGAHAYAALNGPYTINLKMDKKQERRLRRRNRVAHGCWLNRRSSKNPPNRKNRHENPQRQISQRIRRSLSCSRLSTKPWRTTSIIKRRNSTWPHVTARKKHRGHCRRQRRHG